MQGRWIVETKHRRRDWEGVVEPIGLEVTAPGKVSIEDINGALTELGLEPVGPEEIAPLLAA